MLSIQLKSRNDDSHFPNTNRKLTQRLKFLRKEPKEGMSVVHSVVKLKLHKIQWMMGMGGHVITGDVLMGVQKHVW